MNYDNWKAGDYDDNSPVNSKEIEIETIELTNTVGECLHRKDYENLEDVTNEIYLKLTSLNETLEQLSKDGSGVASIANKQLNEILNLF